MFSMVSFSYYCTFWKKIQTPPRLNRFIHSFLPLRSQTLRYILNKGLRGGAVYDKGDVCIPNEHYMWMEDCTYWDAGSGVDWCKSKYKKKKYLIFHLKLNYDRFMLCWHFLASVCYKNIFLWRSLRWLSLSHTCMKQTA